MFRKALFPAISSSKPLPSLWVFRFLAGLVIILSLLAGFYQVTLQQERRRYLRLEDMYVRVRGELGVQETQRLIDQSRQAQP